MYNYIYIYIHMYINIGVRGSPYQDLLSLGAMGQGPARFLGLFAYRRVRFCDFIRMFAICFIVFFDFLGLKALAQLARHTSAHVMR